jgi:hypothetical protein
MKRLDPASPEFRDLVKSVSSMKNSLPPLKMNNKNKYNDLVENTSGTMTGIPDADREVLMRLDDRELYLICLSPKNKYSNKLCNEDFFRNRSAKYLSKYINMKQPNLSWKKFYVYMREILELIGEDSFERFLKNKNTPLFITIQGYFLSDFLRSLNNKGEIEQKLYTIMQPLLEYHLSSMKIVLKVMMILQRLNLRTIPHRFMQYFDPIESLDQSHLEYINHIDVKEALRLTEERVDKIFRRVFGKDLDFLSFLQ